MHIVFWNPQGNFDAADSHLTAHPDFGGQLVYVKEVALAMAELGHRVDIITRRIDDPDWPEFSSPVDHYPGHGNVRILRFEAGGLKFLNKEALWPHMDEFVRNVHAFYGDELPDFSTAHYADGGYCAVVFQHLTGIPFTFTGHSLGAQKLDKLGMAPDNATEMEDRYKFSKRIAAERATMTHAARIITSTAQEWQEQYSHPLYQGAVSVDEPGKFSVIPPGVNTRIFTTDETPGDDQVWAVLDEKLAGDQGPFVIVSSRLDEKKNILGVVEAFAGSQTLRDKARLVICIRGVEDPYSDIGALGAAEQRVLKPILDTLTQSELRDKVRFLDIQSQKALAATYKYFARKGSVFALTAFYEPFGLAPIEAAACGLACVATKNGGPSEIFEDGSGVLVDPFDSEDIAQGLIRALNDHTMLSKMARARVQQTYTWDKTAQGYLRVIEESQTAGARAKPEPQALEGSDILMSYLRTTKNPA